MLILSNYCINVILKSFRIINLTPWAPIRVTHKILLLPYMHGIHVSALRPMGLLF